MPPRQQEPGTSSQSRDTNRQLSVNVSPDAQLIRDHIPHFASLIDKKHQKNQAGTGEDLLQNLWRTAAAYQKEFWTKRKCLLKTKPIKISKRPADTTLPDPIYCAKQVEFLRFCEMRYANRPLATRHQATGDKLLVFLYEKVINRQVRKPGTKHIKALGNSAEEEVSEINKTDALYKKLSYSICNVYVSATMDLWNYQRLMGSNSNEFPRTKVITQLLKVVRMREAKNNRENNVDRATSSMANGYTTKEEVMTISKCIYSNGENFYKYSFGNVVAFLMSHYLLLRGESVRNIEFADLHFQELAKVQSDGSYPAMLMIFNQGKTKKFNKTQTGACMRNKSVEICPFMAMSFHFFWRWHCEKEPFPDMSANGNWFKLRVVYGARPQSAKVEKKKGKEPARGKLQLIIL
ncbi:uncharacterized protein ATC70_000249 [Mucor velutinosus]|uniref:Ndc10 domain-containing protein n=1 Tax=Mucor velutinosus TaxID=708070 RepID=A0AAN7I1D7_9FUNG|nr:hypothetical protein ATC70_000249 [Mucor velutinosus]